MKNEVKDENLTEAILLAPQKNALLHFDGKRIADGIRTQTYGCKNEGFMTGNT